MEPCSKSHAEVVPGYVKYLIDLGYNVSVCINPDRLKEGLFSRFKNPKIFLNKISKRQICNYLKNNDLRNVKGIMVTTIGKLCDNIHFDEAYRFFHPNFNKKKLLYVVHDAKPSIDMGTWKDDMIILRKLDYQNKNGLVINPHYFGNVKITTKNKEITNFITVGRIHAQNRSLIVDAVKELHEKGYRNFRVTVIGKGYLKGVPKYIKSYFDIKGRLSFSKMYDELEKADFMLTAYYSEFYRTVGTSGSFQLVYGFGKPCVIKRKFAKVNDFDDKNAIIYDTDEEYTRTMENCINMSENNYKKIQKSLMDYSKKLYKESLKNLKDRIDD